MAFEEDQKYKVRGSFFFLVLLIFVFFEEGGRFFFNKGEGLREYLLFWDDIMYQ